jgi:drug/metabolite transporter (DMT)-like permease
MAVLLALMSSVLLGGADFAGGLAAKRMPTLAVVAWSNAAGLVVALAVIAFVVPGEARLADVGWGVMAGLCGSVGAALLYRALATGVMMLAAPIAAVSAGLLPVLVGLVIGERLSGLSLVGVAVAAASLTLVSRRPAPQPRRSTAAGWTALLAIGAGLGFGAFMVALSQTPPSSSLWPLVFARCASLSTLLAVVAIKGVRIQPAHGALRLCLATGVLDMASSVLYLVAVRDGSLAVVGMLASLAPISTVLLARLLLKERTYAWQRVGAGLAMSSVMLLALG